MKGLPKCYMNHAFVMERQPAIFLPITVFSERGGLGLINVKERIQAIQALEYLQANQQLPETDNVLFEVGLHQKTLYGMVVVKGANAPQTKELINLLLKDINKINQYTAAHKIVKPKNIQDILFPPK